MSPRLHFNLTTHSRPLPWFSAPALFLASAALLWSAPAPERPDGRTTAFSESHPSSPNHKSGAISLQNAVHRALRASPELKAFAWTAESALARVREAAFWPNPEIEFERENFGGSGEFSGSNRAENTLALAQMLPLGGDIKHRRRLAEAGRELAAWDYHATRLGVILTTSQRYIETLTAERRLALARRELDLARELESVTTKRVEAGEASPVESARVAVPVVEAELKLTRAELADTAARQRLALAWGERSLNGAKLDGVLDALASVPEAPALVATVNNSPAVARWAAEISARAASKKLVRAEAIPDPVVRIGMKQDESSNDLGLIVGISLPLPVFDRNQGALEAARADERAAEQNRHAAELRVESALSTAYFTLSVAHAESVALRERALPAARKAYEATLRAFTAGELPYLDVLEASRALLELEHRQVDALADYHKARAELAALLGGQLPEDPVNPL